MQTFFNSAPLYSSDIFSFFKFNVMVRQAHPYAHTPPQVHTYKHKLCTHVRTHLGQWPHPKVRWKETAVSFWLLVPHAVLCMFPVCPVGLHTCAKVHVAGGQPAGPGSPGMHLLGVGAKANIAITWYCFHPERLMLSSTAENTDVNLGKL